MLSLAAPSGRRSLQGEIVSTPAWASRSIATALPKHLGDDENRALHRAYLRGNRASFDRLVLTNLRLVYAIARRRQSPATRLEDLFQQGILGLIRAIEKWEPDHNGQPIRLSTYAVLWIRSAIDRYATMGSLLIKQPHGKPVTSVELVDHSDETMDHTGSATFHHQGKVTDYHIESRGNQLILRKVIERSLAQLGDRDRIILSLRYLEGRTMIQTRDELVKMGWRKVTKQRIGQLEKRALMRLRGDSDLRLLHDDA